jgi:mono/diheme cytochrome c family protein
MLINRTPVSAVFAAIAFCALCPAFPAASNAQTANPTPAATASTDTPDTMEPRDPVPPLPTEVLKDAKVIEIGGKLWAEQCAHCHGSKAYPGKAPKLQPRNYKPEFVWDRVHNGFRGMPPWKYTYKPEEVVALVAYVLSDDFFP